MAKSKRVLVLVHPQFRPDRGRHRPGTEYDVWMALRRLGHSVQILGVREDLAELDSEMAVFRPQIVFNLLEEFQNQAVFDFHVVSYLEAVGVPYTGCNPRGLIQSRNKFLMSRFAQTLGLSVPQSFLLSRQSWKMPKALPPFPLFVKLNREHASLGIRESNRVVNLRQLKRNCARLRRDFGGEILIQEFVPGADVSVGLWGNHRPEVFSPRRLNSAKVSTARLKFSLDFQRRHSIKSLEFKSATAVSRIQAEAKQIFQHFDLSGYARFDFRVGPDQVPYLIDINPNPNLAKNEDFALSLRARGWTYIEVIENILRLGLTYKPNV